MSGDWRGGFVFIGNHLALDFLNTKPQVGVQLVDLFSDGGALARWLAAAALIPQRESSRLKARWSSGEFLPAIEAVRKLRENLRKVVFQIERGESPSAAFVKDLNRLLAEHPYTDWVVPAGSSLGRRKRFAPQVPEDALSPLADAIADLLTVKDSSRIRKCSACVLHFYDTSKKGNRQWCSMHMCGNRSKVAAFARRQRAALRG